MSLKDEHMKRLQERVNRMTDECCELEFYKAEQEAKKGEQLLPEKQSATQNLHAHQHRTEKTPQKHQSKVGTGGQAEHWWSPQVLETERCTTSITDESFSGFIDLDESGSPCM